MAAVRTMMSAAREEAAILSTEMATAARTGGGGVVERVMSPVAVRQAAEASVKEAGESALSQHLSLAHAHVPTTTIQSTTLTSSGLSGASISTTRTIVTQAIEEDLGVTLREVMSNATQTGIEEQMDEVVHVAKAMAQAA